MRMHKDKDKQSLTCMSAVVRLICRSASSARRASSSASTGLGSPTLSAARRTPRSSSCHRATRIATQSWLIRWRCTITSMTPPCSTPTWRECCYKPAKTHWARRKWIWLKSGARSMHVRCTRELITLGTRTRYDRRGMRNARNYCTNPRAKRYSKYPGSVLISGCAHLAQSRSEGRKVRST